MPSPVVLITGASGKLGHGLTARLRPTYTVVGADVSEPAADPELDSVEYLDVTSGMSVRKALEAVAERHGVELAAVVHLAAHGGSMDRDDPAHEDVNVEGTRRLLTMLSDFRVERFVFASTVLVHAPIGSKERIAEDSAFGATSPYARSKLAAERIIAEHRPRIPYTLLRLADVYTDYGEQPTLVRQIQRIVDKDLKRIPSSGNRGTGQARVHIDDAVDALTRAVERRDRLGDGAILIGEPDPIGYADLQDRIGTLYWGAEWSSRRAPRVMARAGAWIQEHAPGRSVREPDSTERANDGYRLDITRAREMLGWAPSRRLSDELAGILQKLRDYPVAWRRANGLEESGATESLGW